ncbi:GntR family transcriptional regulator [Orrella dioscoreae]|uniref:GntR family transcriptional regulator n=1 Tax=Orrella dioscoreae TaxID=1851544 RepID=UPI000830FE00|nr:GntR family transcriptional regulator [Orrella dioscoreae]
MPETTQRRRRASASSSRAAPGAQTLELTLRDRIARQSIAPGSKLRETDLAQEYKVSRAQVREAFAGLALRGLIERVPNRGAVVFRLDYEQVAEIFSVREVLEGMSARLAAERSRPQDWEPFLELFNGPMVRYLKDEDFEAFLSGYESFRRSIIVAADHRTLSAMLDSISEKIMALSRRIIILPGRGEQALKEHKAVLQALHRGDADAAEALRKANMRSGWEWFARYRNFIL